VTAARLTRRGKAEKGGEELKKRQQRMAAKVRISYAKVKLSLYKFHSII
jgi:hypothetical protein